MYRLPTKEKDGLIDMTADEEISVYVHPTEDVRMVTALEHWWQLGDLGQLKGHHVILVDVHQSIWVSQNGDCGYWPANEVTFVQHTGLVYQYIHWKETVVDWFAGKFTPYFTIRASENEKVGNSL